jgi:DEAD/DEAH box helicase domain-containing protein
MITQEEKGQDGAASRQYVMLYDSVPGGTGYLHELLANDTKTLIDAVRLALSQLAACSCKMDPDKDGCIDLSTSTALAERWPLCPRDRARSILEHLSGSLHQMERVASIADIYINPNFDSELEVRFIESLRRLSGQGGLPFIKLIQEIVQGKSGYLLEVGRSATGSSRMRDSLRLMMQGESYPTIPSAPLATRHFKTRVVRICCHNWKFSVGVITKNTLDESGRAKR